ncbi:MAG: hypothetical protein CMM02_06100 [Rhodopirellula sp.]|nr:hypothetical protein [Rhodopirellula sp.]
MKSLFLLLSLLVAQTVMGADFQHFETHIRPLLIKHCYDCHNSDVAEGNLRLDLREGLLRGGDSGPAIVSGHPSKSLLIKAVKYDDPELKMPPADSGLRLTREQIKHLEDWIRNGAPDPRDGSVVDDIARTARDHWAFQQISVPEVPQDSHPIDYLLSRQLDAMGFTTLGQASTRTLIRRLAYNLTGLPPSLEDLATVKSDLPLLIDKYLSSPRYGERWGRHWLDVARYSDAKDGVLMYGDARIRPFAYTYRDYVIRAFNADTPYDEFIREQLAADKLELPDGSPKLAAMGLLTLGRLFDNNIHDVIDDQIDVVTRGFLGLTASCARCHDHKFDPIPTADYYSLYGVFASSEEPFNRPRIAEITKDAEPFEIAYKNKLIEIENRQATLYEATLKDSRYRTTRHLIKAATTEPDNLETTIFFLSLIKGQLRPQITYAWREYLAEHSISGDRIFGPWADMMASPVLQIEKWRQENVEPRVIAALEKERPTNPIGVANVYGTLITDAWSARASLQSEIEELSAQLVSDGLTTINIADLVAGGNGFGHGEKGEAVHPATGKTVTGGTGSIDAPAADSFVLAENPFIDGVFIPRNSATQVVSSTGLKINDSPVGLKTGSWDYIRYGPSQGHTTNSINGVDYGVAPNWLLGLHANKGLTFDLAAIRNKHSFEKGVFKAVIGHGGAVDMSTIDVAIYLDGTLRFRHRGFKAQQSGPEIAIPIDPSERFLTILVTEGTDGNSHDQGILGNPLIDVSNDQSYLEKLKVRKSKIKREITSLQERLASTPDPNEDELAQILLGDDSPVWFPKRKLYFYLDRQDKDSYRGLLNSIDSLAVSDSNAPSRAMILVDKPQLYDPVIFQRGDPVQRGNPVPRQFFEFLAGDQRKPFSNGSGRLDLANAIASPDNPLTPRVWANRIWMHHFGSSLFGDPSDLGLRNSKPLQFELLDYLANYLITNNYQTKSLHRLILTSSAYQRTSIIPEDDAQYEQQLERDPTNGYYWRFNRRRLDLEQMRDTMLSVSGLLDSTMYGRPPSIADETNNRRTVYSFVERQNLPTIIQVFDAANADSSTSQRPSTTVPQQALFALNSPFMGRMAVALASRINSGSTIEQVNQLYRYVYGRSPTDQEMTLGTTFLQANALRDYAQALLISNEVWFID